MSDGWFVASYVVLWLLVVVLGLLLLALYRELGQLYLRTGGAIARDGPKLGRMLSSIDSMKGVLELASGRHLVIFGNEACSICEELLPELAGLSTDANNTADVHVLISSDQASLPEWTSGFGLDVRPISRRVATELNIRVSPFALVVADGMVRAKGLVNRATDVARLVEQP